MGAPFLVWTGIGAPDPYRKGVDNRIDYRFPWGLFSFENQARGKSTVWDTDFSREHDRTVRIRTKTQKVPCLQGFNHSNHSLWITGGFCQAL